MLITCLGIIVGVIGFTVLVFYLRYFIPLRPKEDGFNYVHVDLDGSVRELDEEEMKYLKIEFDEAGGARPYIKSRYRSLTPEGKIWGYIPRRRVPKRIKIKPCKTRL